MTHLVEKAKSYLKMWKSGLLLCVGLCIVFIFYYASTPERTVTLSERSTDLGHKNISVERTIEKALPVPETTPERTVTLSERSTDLGHKNVRVERTREKALPVPELSAEGFLQMREDIRTEFVSSLRKLLADGADRGDKPLIQLIQRHMFPPSKKKYKMSFNYGPPPQTEVAKAYFKSKEQPGGFFVECGGLDGERSSNTYHLEAAGWQGLLIEADPDYFLQSLGKNRRSWKLNAALCPSAEPGIVSFKDSPNKGHGKLLPGGNHDVPCIPLALVMKVLNRTRIDFFSLDVEGLEVKILKSLPYKDLDIRAITMEYNHDVETPAQITTFMKSVGYKLHKKIDKHNNNQRLYTNDLFFVKNET